MERRFSALERVIFETGPEMGLISKAIVSELASRLSEPSYIEAPTLAFSEVRIRTARLSSP